MKVDSGLCQPAGTPISRQLRGRLGVSFIIGVEASVLRPVHVSVERCITRLAHAQAAFDALAVVFSTADTTRLNLRTENGGISGLAIDGGLWRNCRIHPAPKDAGILPDSV
jgi:hypothetical protein